MTTPLILLTRPEISADIGDFLSGWQIFHAPLSRIQFLSLSEISVDLQKPYTGIIVTSQAGAAWLGQTNLTVGQREWPCWVVGHKTAACLQNSGYHVTKIFATIADLLTNLTGSHDPDSYQYYLYPTGYHRSVEVTDLQLPVNLHIDQLTVYENKKCTPNQEFSLFWQEVADRRKKKEEILAVCPQYSRRSLYLLQYQIHNNAWQDLTSSCSLVGLSQNILSATEEGRAADLVWREKIQAKHPTETCIRDVLTYLYARDCASPS